MLTKVRRRVVFGAGTVTLAVVLMVVVPLAGLLPGGAPAPALWLAIAGVGMVAIVVAALLEQGRAVAHKAIIGFRDATKDWEGWSAPHPPTNSAL